MELGMLVPQCVPCMSLSHPYSPGRLGRKGSWEKTLFWVCWGLHEGEGLFEAWCFCTQALNTPGEEEENSPGTAAVLWLDIMKRKKKITQ